MAPPNDNFANAIQLTTAVDSHGKFDLSQLFVEGDSTGATQEANEQPSYTKTVWYHWIPPVFPATGALPPFPKLRWRLMTRYNPHIDADEHPPTDFDTLLVLYRRKDSSQPWSLTNIAEIERSDAAAGWEKGSELLLPPKNEALPDTAEEFYIRVDGKKWDKVSHSFVGAEGKFVLSWEPFRTIFMTACSGCPPQLGQGITCLGVITPDIFENADYSFGVQPKGLFLLKYCGGSWNHVIGDPNFPDKSERLGWVVMRVPPGVLNAPEIIHGWFTTIAIAGVDSTFPEPNTVPGLGYGSAREAEEGMGRCARMTFRLAAPSDVQIKFRDDKKTDNVAGPTNPHFGLYRFHPAFALGTCCPVLLGASGTTRYQVDCQILNFADIELDGVTVTLDLSGGVSSPTAPVVLNFGAVNTPGATQNARFQYDMLPMGKTDGTLTLKLSIAGLDDPVPDLTRSLLPAVTTKLLLASRVFRGGPATKVCVNVGNSASGPTYNLQATVTAKAPDGTAITVLNDNGAPQSIFSLGQLTCNTTGNCNLLFDLPTVNGATVTIAYQDTLIAYPPARVSISAV
jgi:hypothetical protein